MKHNARAAARYNASMFAVCVRIATGVADNLRIHKMCTFSRHPFSANSSPASCSTEGQGRRLMNSIKRPPRHQLSPCPPPFPFRTYCISGHSPTILLHHQSISTQTPHLFQPTNFHSASCCVPSSWPPRTRPCPSPASPASPPECPPPSSPPSFATGSASRTPEWGSNPTRRWAG